MYEQGKARGSSFEINVTSNLPCNCCRKPNSLFSLVLSYLVGIWETPQQFSVQMLQHAFFGLSSIPILPFPWFVPQQHNSPIFPGWLHSTSRKMTNLCCDIYFGDYYTEFSDVLLHMAVMLKDAPCQTSAIFLPVCRAVSHFTPYGGHLPIFFSAGRDSQLPSYWVSSEVKYLTWKEGMRGLLNSMLLKRHLSVDDWVIWIRFMGLRRPTSFLS